MALSAALQAYLDKLPEDTRKILAPVVEANPELGEGWLRQEDYSRKSAELQTQREQNDTQIKTWKDWWAKTEPAVEKMKVENPRLREENAALIATNAEIKAQIEKALKEGGDVDPALLQSNIDARITEAAKARGWVTKAEQTQIMQEEVTKLIDARAKELLEAERKNFMEQTLPATVHFNQALLDIRENHREEFGKSFSKDDRQKLSDFMRANGITDPERAYDQWVTPQRTAKAVADATKKGEEDGKKSVLSTLNLPGTGAVPTPEIGHMEQRYRTAQSAPTNTREAAAAAAQELVAEGKF